MNAESQLHWCGYSECDGTVERPVQLPNRTRAAAEESASSIVMWATLL